MIDAIPRAISTTDCWTVIKRNATQVSITAQTTVSIRDIFNSFPGSSFLPNSGLYKSSIAEEDSEVIDPARVEIAAANKAQMKMVQSAINDGHTKMVVAVKKIVTAAIIKGDSDIERLDVDG